MLKLGLEGENSGESLKLAPWIIRKQEVAGAVDTDEELMRKERRCHKLLNRYVAWIVVLETTFFV
jgi:hypothetical protein